MTTEYIGFFNDSTYRVIDGNICYAKDLNNPMAALETGLTALTNAVQTGATILTATDTGSANAYVINPTAALTELTDGQMVWLKPGATNTGASTINVSSLGTKNIRSTVRTALVGGELLSGYWHMLKYSSTLDAFVISSERGKTDIELAQTIAGGDGIGVSSVDDVVTIAVEDGGITPEKLSVAPLPVGAVIAVAGSIVPDSFLECDGAAVNRTTYASLFTVISDDYGAGNGTTTFNLPDYRGRFLRGWAHGQTTDPDKATRTDRGDGTGGDVVGSKQADEFKAHTHTAVANVTSTYVLVDTGGGPAINVSNSGSTGGNETRPININVMYCIKYL